MVMTVSLSRTLWFRGLPSLLLEYGGYRSKELVKGVPVHLRMTLGERPRR